MDGTEPVSYHSYFGISLAGMDHVLCTAVVDIAIDKRVLATSAPH